MEGDDQYNTETYGKQDATRSVRFSVLPPVLHLQLKRFEFNMQTYSFDKVNTAFEFPEEIDLAPYMAPPDVAVASTSDQGGSAGCGGSSSGSGGSNDKVVTGGSSDGAGLPSSNASASEGVQGSGDGGWRGVGADGPSPAAAAGVEPPYTNSTPEETARAAATAASCRDTVYVLHSVLVHSGSVGAGHYYAYIRPRLGMSCKYRVIGDGSVCGDESGVVDVVTASQDRAQPPSADTASERPTTSTAPPGGPAAHDQLGGGSHACGRPVAYKDDSDAMHTALTHGEVSTARPCSAA